jgi:ribosomal protein S18 acetylase RimI-like enzyme
LALWLEQRGSEQWKAFRQGGEAIVAKRFEEGQVFLMQVNGEDAGCLVLQDTDAFWGEAGADPQGAFLHSVAVDRRYGGRALGEQAIAWAEARAKAAGKRTMRLDVHDDNVNLKGYYRSLGYGEAALRDWESTPIRLMEKPL